MPNGVGRLASSDVHWIVNSYIGVGAGFLGDFSERTHREFYSAYCDLEVDADAAPGRTTRERFISILTAADARMQAAILRGIARRFPEGTEAMRTPDAFKHLASLLRRCSSDLSVATPDPVVSSAIVKQALADATVLLRDQGPASATDRIHTALHAYLQALCQRSELPAADGANVPQLFKCVRLHHPAFEGRPDGDPTIKALQGLAQVIEGLNQARNHNSLAHPNEALLDRNDALLALNAANALIHYLDAKSC